MHTIPQMIDPSVPIGPDDTYNVEAQRFGEPVVPDFPIPYHTEIMESFDGIDMDAAGRVAGNGFYYLLGNIARLHEAVLAYARDFMIDKGFTYVHPALHDARQRGAGRHVLPGDGRHDVQDRGRGPVPHRHQRAHHDRPLHRPDSATRQAAPDPDLLQPLLPQGEGRPRHRGARHLPHPPVREAGDDRRLPPRGERRLVREAVADTPWSCSAAWRSPCVS